MTQRQFTVVHGQRFERKLASLWLKSREVQKDFDELEPVLRTLPDQAGEPFLYNGKEYWHISHRSITVLYAILADDCQVHLIGIRLKQP